jgi:hypothetical protein
MEGQSVDPSSAQGRLCIATLVQCIRKIASAKRRAIPTICKYYEDGRFSISIRNGHPPYLKSLTNRGRHAPPSLGKMNDRNHGS